MDFNRGFVVTLRRPKGGKTQKIPLNANTRAVIEDIPHSDSEFIFPAKTATSYVNNLDHHFRRIKKESKLPADFRPMHGLRHLYATVLANSGKVDMLHLAEALDPSIS